MIDVFEPIRGLLKLNSVRIDNNIFRLHYRLSVVILVAFALIVGSRKYFGDPIDCTFGSKPLKKIVDNFCWFNCYIIVPKDHTKPWPEEGGFGRYKPVIVDNIQNYEQLLGPSSTHPKLMPYFLHTYQWIEFILFLQAMLFFLPRYLWRYCWEQGRVKGLTIGLHKVCINSDPDANKATLSEISKYFNRQRTFDHYDYAAKFVICEVLNFTNVLAQFCIIKITLGLEPHVLFGNFLSSDSTVDPTHPLNLVFPNLARCEVPAYGGSGHHLSLEFCVLPVNVFVTKIYVFLWFYFLGLTLATGLSVVYRFIVIAMPQLRYFLLRQQAKVLAANCSNAVKSLGYGQWFMLTQVGKNMDPFTFSSLVKEYNDAIIATRNSVTSCNTETIYNPELIGMPTKKNSKMF